MRLMITAHCFLLSLGLYCHSSLAAPHEHSGHSAADCRLKPGADIQLLHEGPLHLPLGEITSITLPLTSEASQGQLVITLGAAEGLELLDTPQPLQLNLQPQHTPSLALRLRANAPGEYLLNLFAQMTDAQGRTSSRAMALVVHAGNPSQGAQKATSPMPIGFTPVVVLPAREIIE